VTASYSRVPATAEAFDEAAYLRGNPDVAAAVAAGKLKSGRQHFDRYGHAEGRFLAFEAPFSFYETRPPAPTNALDLFAGRWSSDIPGYPGYGAADHFNAPLIAWFLERSGDVRGRQILELGPLEAAHTCMLSKAGADVTAIEGNAGAYLRCLIVKEVLGFEAQFLLGDFARFVAETTERFDTVVASGVLYHMEQPIALLSDLARLSNSVLLWTHYFEDEPLRACGMRHKFAERPTVQASGSLAVELWEYRYLDALTWGGFCGGPAQSSNWLTRQGLLDLLRRIGFSVTIHGEQRDHQHGPAIGLLAERAS
jgi:hypothetical protein